MAPKEICLILRPPLKLLTFNHFRISPNCTKCRLNVKYLFSILLLILVCKSSWIVTGGVQVPFSWSLSGRLFQLLPGVTAMFFGTLVLGRWGLARQCSPPVTLEYRSSCIFTWDMDCNNWKNLLVKQLFSVHITSSSNGRTPGTTFFCDLVSWEDSGAKHSFLDLNSSQPSLAL